MSKRLKDEDSSSSAVDATTTTTTKKRSRDEDTSLSEAWCDETNEWSGESESVFGTISDDVLYVMMKTYWKPEFWHATLFVCRRWSSIGSLAFNPFQTARSLMYGVFVNEAHLLRLAQSPRLASVVLDVPVLETICQRVKNRNALDVFIAKGVRTRHHWMSCARKATEKGNWAAVECLTRAFPETARLSREETIELLKSACIRQSKTVLRLLLRRFGESDMNPILASQEFALWCCHKDLSVILADLLDNPVFRTPANMMHVLNYSLKGSLEILVWKVFQLGALDPARYGERALEEACKRGWCNVGRVLISSVAVNPSRPSQKPLRVAAVCGSVPMVELLLEHPDTDPGYQKNTPVREAIEASRDAVALVMLSDPRVRVDNHEHPKESLLCSAIAHGYKGRLLDTLLRMDSNPNQYGHAPLKIALDCRNYDAVRALLAHPQIEIARAELYALLALMGDVPACKDITAMLMHSKKFSHHFVYQK
jgi:ankyrin repeat protein